MLQLLLLNELGTLGVGQLSSEELGLQQPQEMETLRVPAAEVGVQRLRVNG